MNMWMVKVSYYYSDEPPRDSLETDVKICKTEQEAINKLNDIIRDDWTATVEVEGEEKMLADCPGYTNDEENSKYADCRYTEDKKLAWSFFSDGHGYKGQVVPVKIEE